MEQKIYQALASIMKETKAITKTERNPQQNFLFRGIDSVMNEMHELFAKNEVFVIPEVVEYTTQDRPTKSGGMNTYTRTKVKFKYMTTDGSFVETINIGEAMDSGDKGMTKTMSIALKYSLLQMFLIPTTEQKDPDSTSPETDYLQLACQQMRSATSRKESVKIWNNYAVFQNEPAFVEASKEVSQKFPKEQDNTSK